MAVKQVFNTSAELDYPTVLPTLDLDFANSKTLDPRITFTRASGGTYIGADGLIKYAGVNEARFDHDPVTGESLGLLIEESRSNLVLRSQEWATSPWGTISGVVGGFTVTNNVTTSPDGTSNASQINSTSYTSGDSVYQDASATGTGTYTLSVFVKGGTCNSITLAAFFITNSTQGFSFNFNPLTGLITGTGGGSNHTVVLYPNGWYRIYFTVTGTNALNTTLRFQVYTNATGITYLWGAQLEQASFPTSYIPTIGSTRTRAADNASITGRNFREWYRQDEGTVFVNYKGKSQEGTSFERIYSINLNSTPVVEEILLVNNIGYNPDRIGYLVYDNSVNIQDTTGTTGGFVLASSNPVKTAMCYKTAGYAYVFNGGTVITGNAAGVPTVNTLDIGRVGAGGFYNGTIRRLTYYPKRLPNSQLISLTS
jgi:hypothetical protein